MEERVPLNQARRDGNHPLPCKEDGQTILLDCSNFAYPQNAESSSIIAEFLRQLEELIQPWHYRCPDGKPVPSTNRPIEIEIPDEIVRLIEDSGGQGHYDNPGLPGRSSTVMV